MAGVMVALVPKDPEAHLELFRRDQSDFDGTFVLRGVIPGSYTVVAVEDAWGFDWQQPGVLARYVQHGQNLIIGERMQGTVHLPTRSRSSPTEYNRCGRPLPGIGTEYRINLLFSVL